MRYPILIFVFTIIHLYAGGQTVEDRVIGLWKGVIIPGEQRIQFFAINKINGAWEASLIVQDTIRKSIILKEGKMSVEFPEWQFTFTGTFNKLDSSIHGHAKRGDWSRPLTLNKTNPGWTAIPKSTVKDFVVLLKIYKSEKEFLTAEIHNRDNNMNNFLPIKTVHLNGNKLQFELEYFTGYQLRGEYTEGKLILESKRGSNWHPFKLEELNEDDSFQYEPMANEYVYEVPPLISDGWKVSSLEKEGINENLIVNLMEDIGANKYPHLHSITIIRNGKLVLDEYFYGHHHNEIHEIRSVTKQFASALVGLAIKNGFIQSIDESVWNYLKQYIETENQDPRKEAITIRHVLTMTTGLDNDNNDPNSNGEMKMKRQNEESDWVKFNLDLPMADNPGEVFRYSSGGLNIVSAILSNATNSPVTQFIDEYLFEPLNISDYQLFHSPDGRVYLGGDFKLKPRDMAKFGQLYLSDGIWNDQQILSPQWIKESTKVQVEAAGYGLGWWLPTLYSNGNDYQSIYVGGNGGQSIIIIPEFDLVIVFTGGNFNSELYDTRRITEKYIIPAME